MKYIFFNLNILAAFAAFFTVSLSADAQLTGDGSEGNPYKINTAVQLAQLATYINDGTAPYAEAGKHFQLVNDVNLSDYGESYNDGQGWIPIGKTNTDNPFKGVFDGNSKAVTGLWYNNWSLQYNGLFGYVLDGTVKNLIVNGWVNSSNSSISEAVGIIAGYNNGHIINCHTIGYVYSCSTISTSYSGGITGRNNGNISNCSSSANVITGAESIYSYSGGITGYSNGNISNCYSTGTVHSNSERTSYAGGITGYNSSTSIVLNCYSSGSVNSNSTDQYSSYAGGIVGENDSEVLNCYSISPVSATGGNTYAGGIVGRFYKSISSCAALNPSISCSGDAEYFGRIVGGQNPSGTLSSNIAFNGIINPNGETNWNYIGENRIDGENYSVQSIYLDGSLGGRFTAENGWTTQNGKLPGLFGNIVDLPEHLFIEEFSGDGSENNLIKLLQPRNLQNLQHL